MPILNHGPTRAREFMCNCDSASCGKCILYFAGLPSGTLISHIGCRIRVPKVRNVHELYDCLACASAHDESMATHNGSATQSPSTSTQQIPHRGHGCSLDKQPNLAELTFTAPSKQSYGPHSTDLKLAPTLAEEFTCNCDSEPWQVGAVRLCFLSSFALLGLQQGGATANRRRMTDGSSDRCTLLALHSPEIPGGVRVHQCTKIDSAVFTCLPASDCNVCTV